MKKYAPYILILLILVGLFSPTVKIDVAKNTLTISEASTAIAQTSDKSEFEREVNQNECGVFEGTIWPGCVLQIFYGLFYVVPAFLLWLTALVFNFFINITLYSTLYFNNFIPEAWAVVRDLSNIFFILILLYVAVKTILGLGGHEVKKMIVQVIIMALLINFSMFFTKVIIDSSNILALVFYNKISVERAVDGAKRDYSSVGGEKDVAGGLVSAFDPTKSLRPATLEKAKETWYQGKRIQKAERVPPGTMISLILITGLIMFFAMYAFFVSGMSFIGRLIELWILIVFSPFAFMSYAMPKLKSMEYLGWDAWWHRLLKTAFMAPIFMFFLYLIFKLVHSGIFESFLTSASPAGESGLIRLLLSVLIPAMLILVLLLKATKYAKEGGGQIGDMMMAGAKVAGGLALGAATGGAALVGTGTMGKYASSVANNDELKARAASGDKWAQRKLALANSVASKSFDFRQTGAGKFIGKKTGMDLNMVGGDAFKGGYKERQKAEAKAEQDRLKTYEVSGVAAARQDEKAKNWKEKYDSDLAEAEAEARSKGGTLDKKQFEEKYKAGESVEVGDKTFKGSNEVKDSKKINEERGKAYANSLDNASGKNADVRKAMNGFLSNLAVDTGHAMGRFSDNLTTEVGKAMTAKTTIAAAAVTGIATGGIGAAVVAGGAAGAGFINAFRKSFGKGSVSTNAELVTMVKGKKIGSKLEEAAHHFAEAAGLGHGHEGEEHGEKPHAAPHPVTPASPAAAADNHGSEHPPAH